ncbi:MAG: MazG family protein [Candidatus Altiarchaeota archaeon]|nr:MazG family protein [Candidatus Altiarchaeota archaeon]
MSRKFDELLEVMRKTRAPGGCAWDREQTIESMAEHLKNEADEVLDAINAKDRENLKEELGDLLWNIIFVSKIAEDEGLFTINDVMDGVREKIIRRHPHVFGNLKLETSADVVRQYRKIKSIEKSRNRRKTL